MQSFLASHLYKCMPQLNRHSVSALSLSYDISSAGAYANKVAFEPWVRQGQRSHVQSKEIEARLLTATTGMFLLTGHAT